MNRSGEALKLIDKVVRTAVLPTRRIAFSNQIIFYVGRWLMEWLELTANQATWIGESKGPTSVLLTPTRTQKSTTSWWQLERVVYSSDGRHHKASKLRSTFHIVSMDAS